MQSDSVGDVTTVEISRDAFGSSWTLEDDRRFWRRIRGGTGLVQLWKDARRLTVSCLRVSQHPSDREFMIYRRRLMTVCLLLSLAEALPRLVAPELPHFFGRFAAQTFCEMLGRAELLAEEDPDVFRDNEWAQIHPFTYRSVTGTAS